MKNENTNSKSASSESRTAGTEKTVDLEKFVNEIYDLDCKVYEESESALGRVFSNDREKSVDTMLQALELQGGEHILKSEVALIGNMARTIQDKAMRKEAMTQYSHIMEQLHQFAHGYNSSSVMDRERSKLNMLNLFNRFEEGKDHLVICISRTYGSAGNDIGFGLADRLHIDYFDAEIFARVQKRLESEQDEMVDENSFATELMRAQRKSNPGTALNKEKLTLKERLKRLNRYHGLSTRDAAFFNQSDLIANMAESQDFVVMGRCADAVLTNKNIPHVSIFITAPLEQRIHRMMEMNGVSYKEAKRQLGEVDKMHAKYYEYFTGNTWGDAGNYDLCVNSGTYGVKGSIDFIMKMLQENGLTTRE